MKVGIISMQRVNNYGSFLQAYSLKKNIEAKGHECEFIDIKPGETILEEKKKQVNYLSKIDKYFLKRVRHYFFSKERHRNFTEVYSKWLGLTNESNWDKKFDLVIIGSDEVFNCTQSRWGLSPNLLGADINAKKIITYAASCGYTTYEKLKELGIEDRVAEYLSNIDSFSVRDKNTFEFVKKMTDQDSLFHLDPVFLYDYKDEIEEKQLDFEYILIYAYDGRINSEVEIEAIQSFAKENNLKTLSAGLYQSWCDKNISANPFEILGYVKNARYVVTDTFHGSVFSIKYKKPFAALIRESNTEKLYDLLSRFNLEDHNLIEVDNLPSILKMPIDSEFIEKTITKYKDSALEYLSRFV